MRQGWERAGCTYCSENRERGQNDTKRVCQQSLNLSFFISFIFIKSLCQKVELHWQMITSRQSSLDRIKLVTIKLSGSHCLRLGSSGENIKESQGAAGGVRRGGGRLQMWSREYTELYKSALSGRDDNRILPKICAAGCWTVLGRGRLSHLMDYSPSLEPLEEICCCVYADGVALQRCRLGHQLSIYNQYFVNSTQLILFFLFLVVVPQRHSGIPGI